MLHFTLVELGSAPRELVLDTSMVSTGTAFASLLAEQYGAGRYTVVGQTLVDLTPGQVPLIDGAVVIRGESQRRPGSAAPPPSLVFAVNTGPDAGQLFPLVRGSYNIGRTGCAISISDPELSRSHAILTVSDHHIHLEDQDSANGSWVDGERIGRTDVNAGSQIRLGSSRCSVVPGTSWEPGPPGNIDQNPLVVDSPPPPEKNRMIWVTALLPLVLGVVLAVTTQMWFFLAFSALSAVTGLIPLLSGRRKHRNFSAAVDSASRADEQRRRRASPDAGELHLLVHHEEQLEPGQSLPLLRIGLADQPANIIVKPDQPGWAAPVLESVPATIDISSAVTILIQGSPDAATALVRSLVLQLSMFRTPFISYGRFEDIPPGLRFLPGSDFISDAQKLLQTIEQHPAQIVILWRESAQLKTALADSGKSVVCFHGEDVDASVIIDVSFHGGTYSTRYEQPRRFIPDLVAARTFETTTRSIAAAYPPQRGDETDDVPDAVRLDALCPALPAGITRAWSEPRPGLRAPLGSAGEPLSFDLVRQGPHLLVAGTTGAGKSELLRALVLGIAASHPPSVVNFLFIDFKGGSGLGVLDPLPHSVGMLTDLSAESITRALVSLKAEVRRREHLFARHKVSDIDDYGRQRPESAAVLPRLVIVVDEFRMLTEEVPTAVQDLMRIATLGRSLGVHLIMATQRPQGAITPDIRANVTASIALRVQSAIDSQDVLDSPVAASIPVSRPGRAFIKIGNDAPVEFQTASTLGGADPATSLNALVDFQTYLQASVTPPPASQSETQLEALLRVVRVAATGFTSPWRPIQPALPESIPAPAPSTIPEMVDGESDGRIEAGILDLPEQQRQQALQWDPDTDSHLALLGISGSGIEGGVRALALGLTCRSPSTHLYVLDGDSLLGAAASLPTVGAYVSGHEVKRASRLLTKVSGMIADRLADSGRCALAPPLVLIVTGWGRWVSVLRSSRWAWGEDVLGDIVRDGEKAGVSVLISGDRDLLASRFFTLLTNRIFLPTGSSHEALMMWPKRPHMDVLPGRAYVQGRISTPTGAVAQLSAISAEDLALRLEKARACPTQRPFRVEPLPMSVNRTELAASLEEGNTTRISVGLGGDELDTIRIGLSPRSVAAVLGGPGTGKSNFLKLIIDGAAGKWEVLTPVEHEDPAGYWTRAAERRASADPLEAQRFIAVVDDADQLSPEVHQNIAKLQQYGGAVVFTAKPTPTLISKVPLAMEARSSGTGVILGARQASDADFFGVRLELEGRTPKGRAHFLTAGDVMEIQLAIAG